MDNRKPTLFNIQAVENSEILTLKSSAIEDLTSRIPKLDKYFRHILQRAVSASLMKTHFLFSLSGEKRYCHFLDAFPEFVQRVPQYMLAPYLGISPEYLSEIRNKS